MRPAVKKKIIKTGLKIAKILELTDKNIIPPTRIFKGIYRGNIILMDKQVRKLSRRIETIMK